MEIIFFLIITALIFADFSLYKTLFTPFSLISSIYLILILLNNYVAIHLTFFKVEDQSILYIMFFLIIIYLISLIFYFLFKKNKFKPENNIQKYVEKTVIKHKKLILCIFFVGLISKYISLFQVISIYGFNNIKGTGFGIFAHLGNLGLVVTPFLLIYFLQNKKWIYLVLIVVMYINLALFGGKYGIIIAMLHLIILYAMLQNFKIKLILKVGVTVILISVSVFVIIYAVIPSISNENYSNIAFNDLLLFSLNHFLFYLVSPVIATNYYFANAGFGNFEILFTVPINIAKAIFQTGEYISPINTTFIPVHSYYSTNVGGLFSETVYQSSFLVAIVYIALFFIFVYYIFNLSRYRGKFQSLTALLLAVVAMMFFSNFNTVSGIVLQIIFLFIIELIIIKRIVIK